MTRDDVLASLRRAANELLDVDIDRIDEDTAFTELDVDSIDVVDVMLELEKQYDVEVDEAEFRELRTVGDVVSLIYGKAHAAAVGVA